MTGLEALDKILHYIEKQYGEKLEKIVFTKSNEAFEIETLRKELKALLIIKNKEVDVRWGPVGIPMFGSTYAITDEEIKLLEEVFKI